MSLSTLIIGSLLTYVSQLHLSQGQSCDVDCYPSAEEVDCACANTDAGQEELCAEEFGVVWGECTETTTSDDSIVNDTTTTDTNETSTPFDCEYGLNVDFVGKSGQFKLYPCNNSNDFIKVKFEAIQAYDSDDKKQSTNKVTSFAYASAEVGNYSVNDISGSVYNWKAGYDDANDSSTILGGVTQIYYFEVGKDDVLVYFKMNLYLINNVVIEYVDSGNNTYEIEVNQPTLKFDYTIVNWPFENDDDSLEISVKLTTGGTTQSGSDGGSDNGASSFSWGDDITFNAPETYSHTMNHTETSRDVEVTFDPTGSGKQVDVSFLFLNAGNADKIIYDPLATVSSDTGSDNSGTTNDDGSSNNNEDAALSLFKQSLVVSLACMAFGLMIN